MSMYDERAAVRGLLLGARREETVADYEKMLFRLHSHILSLVPYDRPSLWLADVPAVAHYLSTLSTGTKLKYLNVIVAVLQGFEGTDLRKGYLSARDSLRASAG